MTSIGKRLFRTVLVTGASLVLAAGGLTSPAFADFVIVPVTDCFGNPLTVNGALMVPPGGAAFFGTPGDDTIIGTDGTDWIYGLAGNDVICGGAGEDRIYGDGGNDHIDGAQGTDSLWGGNGDDYIRGGPNTPGYPYHEAIYGDDGTDELYGQSGPDTLLCGNAFIGGDPGDLADGGTGMAGNQPEDDGVWISWDCTTIRNVP
jgi:Ca2+-binding RTX toxin-like protein